MFVYLRQFDHFYAFTQHAYKANNRYGDRTKISNRQIQTTVDEIKTSTKKKGE